jgi:hypothetical protein
MTVNDLKGFVAVTCLRPDSANNNEIIAVPSISITETDAKGACRDDLLTKSHPSLLRGEVADKSLSLPIYDNGTVSVVICKRPVAALAPVKRKELKAKEIAQVKEQVGMQIGSRFIKFEVQRNLDDSGWLGSTLTSLDIAIENSNGSNANGCQLHDMNGRAYKKIIGLRTALCADMKEFGYEDGSDNDICLQIVTAKDERTALNYYSSEDSSLRDPRSLSQLNSANVFSSTYLLKMFSKPGACIP